MTHAEERARAAYEGYAKFTGGKTFDGRDMPLWHQLGERIRGAWVAAIDAGIAWKPPMSCYKCGAALKDGAWDPEKCTEGQAHLPHPDLAGGRVPRFDTSDEGG